MSELARVQRAFTRFIREGSPEIATHLESRAPAGAARGAAIYAHAYRARHAEALLDIYGHTAQWMGTSRFEAAADGYLAVNPPRSPSLRAHGERFPRWLAAHYPGSALVPELAMLDRALRAAFDGPDAAVLTADSLAELAAGGDEIPVAFVPTLQRLVVRHNTLAVWHAIDSGKKPPAPRRLPHGRVIAVWRVGWSPHFRSLGSLESRAMRWVGRGTTLEALCARQAGRDPGDDAAHRVGGLLRRWLDESMLRAS